MTRISPRRTLALLGPALALALSAAPAPAQFFGRPPASVPGVEQAQGADVANLGVRIDRLENQIRTLNGQIEQLQFQNRRLEEQMRKFQQDVDFRFQESSGRKPAPAPANVPAPAPQKRTDLDPAAAPLGGTGGALASAATPQSGASAPTRRRGDAFDPAAQPGAPGAPRQIGAGTPLPTGPVAQGEDSIIDEGEDAALDAPLDLSRPGARPSARVIAGVPPQNPAALPQPQYQPIPVAPGQQSASLQPPPAPLTPNDEYVAAVTLLKAKRYEEAETGLRDFLRKHPRDRLAADAIYNLGDTYTQRSRHREAAEQYLKLSTDYPKSSRTPPAMVRLGTALAQLGAKEQACATYGEVARKYPGDAAAIRNAEREMKRAQC